MMQRLKILVTLLFTVLTLLSFSTLAAAESVEVAVSNSADDGFTKTGNGETNITKDIGYIGDNYVMGWRFENVSIPQGATVTSAVVEFYCANYCKKQINLTYGGELVEDPQPFLDAKYELSLRQKTVSRVLDSPAEWENGAWVTTPQLVEIIQEIVNQSGWQSGNAITILAEDAGSAGKRNLNTVDKSPYYGARLKITFETTQLLPGSDKYTIDTNGDGIADVVMEDKDQDGYFECPTGTIQFLGTLSIDQPVEIMGSNTTRSLTVFEGEAFKLTGGGIIISDLMSPVVSSGSNVYPGLIGNDLQIIAFNGIVFENGGLVYLGGDVIGTYGGNIYLTTVRLGANLIVRNGAEAYGRHMHLVSNGGSIIVENGCTLSANAEVKFQTFNGNINLNQDVTVWASSFYYPDAWIYFKTVNGSINLSNNVAFAADGVDMCDVVGTISDDGSTSVIGQRKCW